MQLYSGATTDFLRDDAQHDLLRKLNISFLDSYRHTASPSEQASWQYSLHSLATQIDRMKLHDHGIILEMQLPLTSRRLDCMLTGLNASKAANAVIIELKQWSYADLAEEDECVTVQYGPALKTQLHPSVQVAGYCEYLHDTRAIFYENPSVLLSGCTWLHNFQYNPSSPLLDAQKFGTALSENPLFCAADSEPLADYIHDRIGGGKGMDVLRRVLSSRYAPSKKLMEHTAQVIRGEPVYTLLDEQRIAYEKVMAAARRAVKRRSDRTVISIKGGPGTGKSLIALNAMADLLSAGFNVQHATGSKAFTENLRKILGRRASAQFNYFNSFGSADAGDIDVLIMDEAHRIRESSNNQYTTKADRSDESQIEELVSAAKVAVFFIDDKQVVRPYEVGSSAVIRQTAAQFDARFEEQELVAQFRCAGSDEYIDWIDQVLNIRDSGQERFDASSEFRFSIFDSPESLDAAIRHEQAQGQVARVTAGFCWPWSKPQGGALINDVVLANYRRPWNARPDAVGLPKGVPKSNYWATDPRGLDQIGCVYTAQGFEFDFVGVIFANDLVYRDGSGWVGNRAISHDNVVKRAKPEHFVECIKNTYRVLLTRGLKGCFVYFMDDETREYFQTHLTS